MYLYNFRLMFCMCVKVKNQLDVIPFARLYKINSTKEKKENVLNKS